MAVTHLFVPQYSYFLLQFYYIVLKIMIYKNIFIKAKKKKEKKKTFEVSWAKDGWAQLPLW